MINGKLLLLTPILAGALWALVLASPSVGRVAILLYIVLLPLLLGAAAWLIGRVNNKNTR